MKSQKDINYEKRQQKDKGKRLGRRRRICQRYLFVTSGASEKTPKFR